MVFPWFSHGFPNHQTTNLSFSQLTTLHHVHCVHASLRFRRDLSVQVPEAMFFGSVALPARGTLQKMKDSSLVNVDNPVPKDYFGLVKLPIIQIDLDLNGIFAFDRRSLVVPVFKKHKIKSSSRVEVKWTRKKERSETLHVNYPLLLLKSKTISVTLLFTYR